MIEIEAVTPRNFKRVLPLIAQYQRFYGAKPDDAANRRFFRRFLRNRRRGIQFLAVAQGREAVGFATLYFGLSSLSATAACTLNDLFSIPKARGRGVGSALIAHCAAHARRKGFSRIEWQTRVDNHRARKFYARLPARSSLWRFYSLPV